MIDTEGASRIRARLDAPAHVQQMLSLLKAREGVSLETVRQDPLGWLTEWAEVEVFDLERPGIESDQRCDVDGLYRGEDTPPRIGIAFSDTQQRMNFTALHELGHHIQMTDDDLVNALIDRPDGGNALEEAACDSFAAAILIPEAIASTVLGAGTPSAESVTKLWTTLGTASRSAVAIRALRQIDGDGHVVVLNANGGITFSTSTSAFRPVRRSDQTRTPIWSAIEQHPRSTVTARGQFAYNSVLSGETYYMQAAPAGNGFIVVAATERVPWRALSVAYREYAPYGRSYICPHLACAAEFRAGPNELREVCNHPTCPTCGRCECSVAAQSEFQCTECLLLKGASQASAKAGVCTDCV